MPRKRKRKVAAAQPKPPAKKRKQWDNDSMLLAMEAVKSGKLGVNEASRTYGLPSTTLKDRMRGRVVHGTNPGPRPFLDEQEEKFSLTIWFRQPSLDMARPGSKC